MLAVSQESRVSRMVKRTRKEFQEYNDFHDRPFGLKWGTAYALDDLMKGVRENETYAVKDTTAKPQMSREQIDIVLSDSFLQHKEVTIQLNLLDEFGRLVDEAIGHFTGEAYQDYFILEDQKIYWEDVRHIDIVDAAKWFDIDMFKPNIKVNAIAPSVPKIEYTKDEFTQPFYDEEGGSD